MWRELPSRRVCVNCGNDRWKRMVDENDQIIEVCTRCGYYIVVGHPYRSPRLRDEITVHWDGSTDNQEKLLEKDYERGLR